MGILNLKIFAVHQCCIYFQVSCIIFVCRGARCFIECIYNLDSDWGISISSHRKGHQQDLCRSRTKWYALHCRSWGAVQYNVSFCLIHVLVLFCNLYVGSWSLFFLNITPLKNNSFGHWLVCSWESGLSWDDTKNLPYVDTKSSSALFFHNFSQPVVSQFKLSQDQVLLWDIVIILCYIR